MLQEEPGRETNVQVVADELPSQAVLKFQALCLASPAAVPARIPAMHRACRRRAVRAGSLPHLPAWRRLRAEFPASELMECREWMVPVLAWAALVPAAVILQQAPAAEVPAQVPAVVILQRPPVAEEVLLQVQAVAGLALAVAAAILEQPPVAEEVLLQALAVAGLALAFAAAILEQPPVAGLALGLAAASALGEAGEVLD